MSDNRNKLVLLTAASLLMTACAYMPWHEQDSQQASQGQQPVKPVDAFEKVGEPHSAVPDLGNQQDGLSSDIHRLQNARRKYNHDKAQAAAEQRRKQTDCADSGGHAVPIKDGSDKPSVYCQQGNAEDQQDTDSQ